MKVYNISIDKEELSDEGVFTVSLVNKPAIRSGFVYMSEDGKQTYKFSEERGEIVGAVLIPDILIPRKNEALGEYMVTFSSETIADIQYKMSRDGFFNYFNLEHSLPTDSVVMLETWIKESSNDKSTDYGFSELPIGTMFFKAKVEDDDIKQKIKDGELNGFSVELKASLLPKMEQTQESMSIEELSEKIDSLTAMVEKLTAQSQEVEKAQEPAVEVLEEVPTEEVTETLEEEVVTEPVVAEPVAVEPVAEEPVVEIALEEEEIDPKEAEKELFSEQGGEPKEEAEPAPKVVNVLDGRFHSLIDQTLNKFL